MLGMGLEYIGYAYRGWKCRHTLMLADINHAVVYNNGAHANEYADSEHRKL